MRRRDTRQQQQALAGLKATAGMEWMLGIGLLACERRFRRVKGYAEIAPVMARIDAEQVEPQPTPTKRMA